MSESNCSAGLAGIYEVYQYDFPAFGAFCFKVTSCVLENLRQSVSAKWASYLAWFLFGDRVSGSSDFRHEFWCRIDVSDWYAVHAVTSFLNFIYPSSASRLTAVGIDTPNIPQKTLNVALS